jgi:DnaJ-class molecular chaperone
MPKDYYLVLGITSEATLDDIKDAYRKLAKAYHPDHYGENHSPFLAIQEAYSVLSDPIKRQTHDLEALNQKKKLNSRYGERIRSIRMGYVEPLIPDPETSMDLGTEPFAGSFPSHGSSFDELFDKIFYNFRQTSRPESKQKETVHVGINLTPEQALRGGQIKVALPGQLTCPSCSGQGRVGVYKCLRCNGDGILPGECPVIIPYPPRISNNHVVRMSLDTCGIKICYLTVHFRIGEMD